MSLYATKLILKFVDLTVTYSRRVTRTKSKSGTVVRHQRMLVVHKTTSNVRGHFKSSTVPLHRSLVTSLCSTCALASILYLLRTSYSVHDRKMSVLGFCSVIQCPVRPAPILLLANQLVPAMIAQLETLIDLYKRESLLMCITCI